VRKTKAERDDLRETLNILRAFPKEGKMEALLIKSIEILLDDCDELELHLEEHKVIISKLTEQMKNNKEASEAVKLQQAELISHLTNTCTVSADVINNFLDEYRKEVLLKAAKEFELFNPRAEICRYAVAEILTDMAVKKYDE
jgi:hypothetical protein